MMKTNKNKEKGYCVHAVISCHIPYYSTPFFNPDGDLEDGETRTGSTPMVKIPIKIAANGDESRANVTNFEIKGITHFDNNIENVLETFMQLNERVIKPKAMTDKNEEFKTVVKLLHLLCTTGPATQTLQEAMKIARTYVVQDHCRINHPNENINWNALITDETVFYNFLGKKFNDLDADLYPDPAAYNIFLFD